MNTYKIIIGFNYPDENNIISTFYLDFLVQGNNETEASQYITDFLINNPNKFNMRKNGSPFTPTNNNFNITEINII